MEIMRANSVRTSIDLPRDLHEAAAPKGFSARKLILAGIERALEEGKENRPRKRLNLDSPLIPPAGRQIRVADEEIYEFIESPDINDDARCLDGRQAVDAKEVGGNQLHSQSSNQ